jgi:hypothetical protein
MAAPPLRRYTRGLPVHVVEDHHEVLEPVWRCLASRHLPFEVGGHQVAVLELQTRMAVWLCAADGCVLLMAVCC